MSAALGDPTRQLHRALENGRIHTGYLFSGELEAARAAARSFARALVCSADPASAPCDACSSCARSAGSSAAGDPIPLDGKGKKAPYFRHIGDHPDLYEVALGAEDTRVTVGQVRDLQRVLRLGSNEGGRVVAVIDDAEWLNDQAQNALLRLLEEPPDATTLLLITPSAAGLVVTIRSRCQRIVFPMPRAIDLRGPDVDEEVAVNVGRLDRLGRQGIPDVLEWAEEFRGDRARAAEQVQHLLATSCEWLRERTTRAARDGNLDLRAQLDAFRVLQRCRKGLAERNANPQMVAERAILALHAAARVR